MIKFIAALFLAALTSGCALTEDSVPIKYNAPANLTLIKDGNQVSVAVVAQDGRISNRDRISTKKNGYGMEMAKIISSNDITELVRGAVEHELSSFGLTIGPGGLKATVELQTFYNDFKSGFFSGDAVAEVAFNLIIHSSDGNLLYSHTYRGVGMNKNIMLAVGSMAAPALQEALTNAMQQFVSDTGLQTALEQATLQRQKIATPQPRKR